MFTFKIGAAAVVVAAAVLLTGCSSSGDGHGVFAMPTTTTAPAARTVTVTSAPPSTPSAPPTSATSSASPPVTVPVNNPTELRPALLSVAQLGAGWAPTSHLAPSRLPCTPTQPPVDQRLAHTEKGVADFANAAGTALVSEQIYVYGSVTDAIRHQQIDEEGLGCSSGTVDGAPIDVAGPYSLRGRLSTSRTPDKAQDWAIANTAVNGELIFVRIRAVVVQFSFQMRAGAQRPALDVKRVIESGIDKLVAAAG